MRLQACLNGARRPGEHPALPQDPAALARDARRVCAAGAEALHLHLWHHGTETLSAAVLQRTLRQVRDAVPGVPVGVSTGLWIARSPAERLQLIQDWEALPREDRPDCASVNLGEAGAAEVCRVLQRLGICIEAGMGSVADVEALASSGLLHSCLRHLIELPGHLDGPAALLECRRMHARLDALGAQVPRLTHGTDQNAWVLVAEAARRSDATRIGLEDVLTLPDGRPAPDNAALVQAARYTLER
ncbi:3-keto-5-aminohexanoate cleavage protein [Deinococcus sonorensis]|uniref:3-keto-5-aminohexanoate cleavage protein n=2 Tax=Deinococcus sonorensis TaxID=309891 RepID=A0AAU7U942_9DEIO